MTNETNPNEPSLPSEKDPRPSTPPKTIDADSGEEITEAEWTAGGAEAAQDDDADNDDLGLGDFDPSALDPAMFAGVQEMMEKLGRADELEGENAELRNRLGRLAADFEAYRKRTAEDANEARAKGTADAAEALMPVYDDLARAIEMGSADPGKLIPGMKNVQAKVLSVFERLGLSATGQEGEVFDPQWHEALQVVPGEQDDAVVQVFQTGFRMGDRLVRPARVVVSKRD